MEFRPWLYSLPIRYKSWHPRPIEFRLWLSWFWLYISDFNILPCLRVQTLEFIYPALGIQTLATFCVAHTIRTMEWYSSSQMESRLWNSNDFLCLIVQTMACLSILPMEFRLWQPLTLTPSSNLNIISLLPPLSSDSGNPFLALYLVQTMALIYLAHGVQTLAITHLSLWLITIIG